MPTTGRFAPTPSGPLHFGSLTAALASYCQARAARGRWLLRIEDVDTPRVVAGAADRILCDLETFGFEWDGPVLYQSERFELYRDYLDRLWERGEVYACACSRRSLRRQGVRSGPLGQIYPGNCRALRLPAEGHSIRLDTANAHHVEFHDRVYGAFGMDLPRQVGDFVLRRADGIFAYHLAVTVDDELQGIDEVVRGADLLENTCLHLHLQQRLGFRTPAYLHLPLVNNAQGVKLSKQTGAEALAADKASRLLVAALKHLGQDPENELTTLSPAAIVERAVHRWNPESIPRDWPAAAESLDS